MFKLKYIFFSLILSGLVLSSSFITGCSDEQDEIKLKVTCTDSSNPAFAGTYAVDGGKDVGFRGIISEDASTIYSYEVTFEDIDSLEVNVTKESESAAMIVRIYQDGKRKKYVQNDPDSSSRTIDVIYDYQDEDDDTSDDTDTSVSD